MEYRSYKPLARVQRLIQRPELLAINKEPLRFPQHNLWL